MERIEKIQDELKQTLSKKRYLHSLGVMKMAKELAIIHGVNPYIAAITGLAHDMAKEIPAEDKLEYARKNNITVNRIEEESPGLLHAKIGAHMAKTKYGFNEEMCRAIEYHTTMHPAADKLAKIIFVADKTDETRSYSDVEKYRKMAKNDLDNCVIAILDYIIKRNIKKEVIIHPNSIFARNKLLVYKFKKFN